ncbi:MAG: hypothetical protein NTX49_00930 [Chlamydiae bacterium]|nr:hypothetical protein [Chlamydiota bacterium]
MHRESPDSEKAYRAYKALDNKRIILEKIRPLLDRYLLIHCVVEMCADHSLLREMLNYICTGKGGLHELEAEHDALIHQMRNIGSILQALDAHEYYNGLLAQRNNQRANNSL